MFTCSVAVCGVLVVPDGNSHLWNRNVSLFECAGNRSHFRPAMEVRNRNSKIREISMHSASDSFLLPTLALVFEGQGAQKFSVELTALTLLDVIECN